MNLQNGSRKVKTASHEWASYFGVTVEILSRMEHCSLIRWRDREFIVDTADLQFVLQLAA